VVFYQPQIALFLTEIYANDAMPRHIHDDMDQFTYIVSGQGEADVGDETFPVRPGIAYRVPAQTEHGIRNTGSEVLFYVELKVPSAVPASLVDYIEGVFPSLRSTES
jgi:mannose-6-phosphate isomerase-like protein (cupin superfamily)